ncbi:MAG: Holliday junction resolvase RuvX [Xanthomonadales bacterium]|jgi:putative Holliday junction resolvase|nr:Holliday junction resolvase RuvX [Xanthomonadales bacterium]
MPEGADGAWPAGTWLAFDFGLRRIGVAVGQTTTRTANPEAVIRHGDSEPDWPAIRRLVSEWRPAGFVVGLPLGPEGESTPMSKLARAFGARLATEFERPVAWCNERFTSRAAEQRFAERRAVGAARRKDSARLDAMAAAIILENWLQSLPHEP